MSWWKKITNLSSYDDYNRKFMQKNEIKIPLGEYRELLRQAMTLESTLDNLIRNNYRNIPALTIESMRDEASNAVRVASKRLERLHKQETKDARDRK